MVSTDRSEDTEWTIGAQLGEQTASPGAEPARRARRRNLTDDEKREVLRLYSETATPLPEIRQRFGIGDSSLYRLVQQFGGTLRGRSPGARPSHTANQAHPEPTGARANGTARPPVEKPRRAPRAAASRAASGAAKARRSRPASPASDTRSRFRVSFVSVRTVRASDVHDALRQAQASGAIEITEITRLE